MEGQVTQTQGVNSISKNKNGFIEFCRFVFMISIVSHHAMFLSDKPGYIPLWGGYISVEFFFILTGYFLYASYLKNDLGQKMWNKQNNALYQIYHKFKRFYPYFFISWCVIFIMVHMESGNVNLHTFFLGFYFWNPTASLLTMCGAVRCWEQL